MVGRVRIYNLGFVIFTVASLHYRTERIDFLDTVEPFVDLAARAERLDTPSFEVEALPDGATPLTVIPAAP
jgi:hypothetical protein